MNLLRRFLIYSLVLGLSLTSLACGSPPPQPGISAIPTPPTVNRVSSGQYPVQQATYNDANGEYTVMLLNTKPGEASAYRTTSLPMAQLTDDEVAKGVQSYLKVENDQPSLHLSKDFKIDYVHNVTETQNNPQTGQSETMVVRQESSFWSPFAGALAGQALGSLLFRPQYYVPPLYQPGGITGFGGYGRDYNQAVNSYRQRYNAPPVAVRNRQTIRTTGNLRTVTTTTTKKRKVIAPSSGDRSTGSGFGINTLRRSNDSSGFTKRTNKSFGSSGSRRRR
ncbi:MAG: hypothetical protein KME35_16585 [Aphanocapsa sp. GSE-SYN-MK-11-07L]|jgi:hypothetical protein|nr:hypothetical protein [Aphanocapsa sp. GSE-SYN-MK-11-07L]